MDVPTLKRSRFPRRSLEECERLAQAVYQLGARHVLERKVAQRLGYRGPTSGPFRLYRAAAVQWGLVVYRAGALSVAEDVLPGLVATQGALSEAWRQRLLGRPPLFADLLRRWADRPVPDETGLAAALTAGKPWGLDAAQAQLAARVFLASVRHARVIDAEGVLRLPNVAGAGAPMGEPARSGVAPAGPPPRTQMHQVPLQGGGSFTITLCGDLSPADVPRLQRLWELIVGWAREEAEAEEATPGSASG